MPYKYNVFSNNLDLVNSSSAGSGNVVGPATNTDNYIPQWNGADSKTLKNGLAVPAGGLAGLTALGLKADLISPTFTTPNIGTATGSASLNVLKTGDTMSGTLNTFTLTPVTNATYTLGDSTHYNLNTFTDTLTLNATASLSGASAGAASLTGKLNVTGVQTIYVPNQTNFDGSMFLGDGGANLSHSAGNDGQFNLGFGIGTLNALTTGQNNVAVGSRALTRVTTGVENTAIGGGALFQITTGNSKRSSRGRLIMQIEGIKRG